MQKLSAYLTALTLELFSNKIICNKNSVGPEKVLNGTDIEV